MKNKLIFPRTCTYNPGQRTRITDVWGEAPIGLRAKGEYPDILVEPCSSGRHGNDVRYALATPIGEANSYQFEVGKDPLEVVSKYNPKIQLLRIDAQTGKWKLKGNKNHERLSLSTRVTPKNGSMLHHLVLNVPLEAIESIGEGKIWEHPSEIQRRIQMSADANRYSFF